MIEVYTDGACRGNGKSDARGGWGFHAIDRFTGITIKEDFGGETGTTNNRMELKAAIEALKFTHNLSEKDKTRVKIYTDSNYVFQGITKWIHGWIRKGWADVKNVDLWQELNQLNNEFYEWNWVKAHNGHIENEYADQLANKGCDNLNSDTKKVEEQDKNYIERKERFILAIIAIYGVSRSNAIKVFDKYSSHDDHNIEALPYRVFDTIMNR